MQDALNHLGRGLSLPERIALARQLLDDLPATNWFRRNPFVGDHKRGDAELVDLLLHARDRAYRVAEVIELLAAAGLAPTAFIEPLRYDPASYLQDPQILKRLEGLTWIERAALAEALAGNMKTHVVYAAPGAKPADVAARVATPDGPEAVPLLTAAVVTMSAPAALVRLPATSNRTSPPEVTTSPAPIARPSAVAVSSSLTKTPAGALAVNVVTSVSSKLTAAPINKT